MKRLVSTPDFNGLPRLQKLDLINCKELEEIHPSLGNHRSLKSVFVYDCSKLRMFPTIVRMEQLESLYISYCDELKEIDPSLGNHRSLKSVHVSFCSKLRMFPTIVRMEQLESLCIRHCHESLVFPEIKANMECLVELVVADIQIDVLLSSIGERCTNLIYLSLANCPNSNSIEVRFESFDWLKCLMGLKKLDLSSWFFEVEDGEIPPDIGELSNLQDLNLSNNGFSELHFSLSQLTRLKRLNLSGCERLVKLPELPSSIAIIIADGCDKLTSIGDLNENCKWLCYISLVKSPVIDGNRLLQSMLKGNAIEHQSMQLRIGGLEIPKQFTNRLYAGDTCRLLLPENWCNDFCGFLICAVLENHDDICSPDINIYEETSDDMRGMFDGVFWGESFGDKLTWVWYVPFASLRHTEWWNPMHKNVSFYIQHCDITGTGASLVPMNNGSGLTDTSTDSSEFTDDYTHKISIRDDSKSSLTIGDDSNAYDY